MKKTNNYVVALFIVLAAATGARAQTGGFIQQDIIKTAGVTTEEQIAQLGITGKQTTRTYFDGMGRPVQTIDIQGSPTQKDIIQPIVYDNLGRVTQSYLPYAGSAADAIGSYRGNAITAQAAYYNNGTADKVADDTAPFSRQLFENSPLQRLLQAGTVGAGFQPGTAGNHYKTITYRGNTAADGNIILWGPDGTRSGNYAVNALAVMVYVDEDGITSQVFTDAAGRTVLSRQVFSATVNYDTYYVYNNAGLPAYVIAPKATELLVANSGYTLATAAVASLIYQYYYDNLGRVIKKVIPAKGTITIVYDPLNRPVLMQDANLALQHKWNYVKYDAKGRAISQGIYTDATHDNTNIQTVVNAFDYNSNWYETRNTTQTGNYYTNVSFPTANTEPLAFSYYDDYNLTGTPFTYAGQGISGESAATTAPVRGMPTMLRTRSVGAGLGNIWLLKVMFYDKNGSLIQTRGNNQLNYQADVLTDSKTNLVDAFTGVLNKTNVVKVTGTGTAGTQTILTSLTYDHRYRVTAVDQVYNQTSGVQHIASYAYNELGQVVDKKLGGNAALSSWLQSVDYRFSIRGQLTSINNSKLSNDGVLNDDTNDLFGMQLYYDKYDSYLNDWFYYNGRLNSVKWMSKDASGNSSYERAFTYLYDQAGRYTAAGYEERPATASATTVFSITHGWDETISGYDANGNITALQRNAATQASGTFTQVDNLTYAYNSGNANQLSSVTDGTGTNYTNTGFRNYTGSTGSYTYDANGNLTADPYKGLSFDTYNYLNRANKITFTYNATGRYIDYTYDASGILIRKRAYDNNTLQTTTDYIDGFVYLNGTISYAPMPEGRARNTGSSLKPEYIIADQQGNARISFEDNGSGAPIVRQENSYYGLGLVMPGSLVATPTTPNKQLYNGGSEWQNDYGNLPDYQQTFYRNYDAALGRWIAADPIAEATTGLTPYQYSNNNPVMFNDPLGDLAAGGGSNYAIPYQHTNVVGDFNAWLNSAMQAGHGGLYTIDPQATYGLVSQLTGGGNSQGTGTAYYWDGSTLPSGNSGDYFVYHRGINNLQVFVPAKIINSDRQLDYGGQSLRANSAGVGEAVFIGAAALSAGWTADGLDPEPVSKVIGAVGMTLYTGYVLYQNRTYLANSAVSLYNKMTAEIDRIAQKVQGPQGFVYELVATRSGLYPNLNTGVPTFLNAGDVWKYGQTVNGFGRYSQSDLASKGLQMIDIFHGNQMEIRIQEKIMIYGYYFMNGSRPAGNPIFR